MVSVVDRVGGISCVADRMHWLVWLIGWLVYLVLLIGCTG